MELDVPVIETVGFLANCVIQFRLITMLPHMLQHKNSIIVSILARAH